MMLLPQEFKDRMKKLLGEEYAAFEESCLNGPLHALRINPKKAVELFLPKVLWAKDGYYYGEELFFGRHPYHEAGVYYIQEPSAMAPAAAMESSPGERILDLCAAPGGKSTQLAAGMDGRGILVCNEIHPVRARVLSENIERMGICNAVVTNETPERLLAFFGEYFDKVLVDAPCSGEGMFRKKSEACAEWSVDGIARCSDRQDEILNCAAGLLRPGGRLVYSTCTFAPEENEGSVSRFLKRFPMFEIVPAKKTEGMSDGNPAWVTDAAEHIKDTVRLFPHKAKGEGHYFAVLRKNGSVCGFANGAEESGISKKECGLWAEFERELLMDTLEGRFVAFKDQLYLLPESAPSLKGLRTLRPGLHLGTNKKGRFEPSHALALFLNKNQVREWISFSSQEKEIAAYLNGQSLPCEGKKGWQLVLADSFSIGWGKASGGTLKNHYPKGLRKNPDFFRPLPESVLKPVKSICLDEPESGRLI